MEIFEIFVTDDFEGGYIFSDAEEMFYNKCLALSCPELFSLVTQLHAFVEQEESTMVSIGESTASDYENMRSLAITALRDKEKAGLCEI